MAAKTLEELISSLSADEKQLLENTFSKNPDLKGGWLRQDDYSRKMNELKSKESEYQEAVAYKEQMEPWAEDAYERLHGLEEAGVLDPEGKVLWLEQKAAYEKQLDEARKQAVAGGDMTPEQLDAEVRRIVKDTGVALSKEEISALYTSQAKAAAEAAFDERYSQKERDFNDKTIPFVSGFSTSMALAAAKYERETGKEFTDEDTKSVFELMTQKKNFNPREMVQEYAKPFKQAKESEAEIERRVKEELAKRGMPGGGDEPYIPQQRPKGNLQAMLERSAEQDGNFEGKIMAGAVSAAKDLWNEGKF